MTQYNYLAIQIKFFPELIMKNNLASMIKHTRLIFVSLLLSACTVMPTAVNNELSKTGDALFERGDILGALVAWNKEKPTSVQSSFDLSLRKSRAFRELGDAKQALQAAKMCIDYADELKNPKLNRLATIELGLAQLAMSQLELARNTLKNIEASHDASLFEQAQIEMGLAQLDYLETHVDQALSHYQRAKALAERNGDTVLAASLSLLQLQLENDLNSTKTSAVLEESVFKIKALPDSMRRNFMLISLARIAQTTKALNNNALSMTFLNEAEQSSRHFNDDRLLSFALGYQGSYYEQQGNYALAGQLTAEAADAAQRANATESLYLWEWQAARLHQAQHRKEPAIAAYRRAIFDLSQIRQDVGMGQSFRERVKPLFLDFVSLLLEKAHNTTDKIINESLLREARTAIEQLKSAELQDYFQDRCVANFKEKSRGLEDIAEKTAVLYPILLPDRTELIVSFSDGLKQFIIPVGDEKMTNEINEFRAKLEKRTTFQYLKSAKQLYQWLIAPLTSELSSRHIETLVIVPDGAFRTIPFAALYDGNTYLIEHFALATTPSLTLTDPRALPANEHLELLLNGLTQSVQGFAALPNVEKELAAIQSEFGGKVLKDQDFQLSTLENTIEKAVETNPYRIVHIASHGQFDRNPKKTFLLAYDSKITMDALERYISASKYQNKTIELLTLSACQTAAGDDRAALGMAGVAVKAGAKSALASLWFINDQASSDLISMFYDNLKQQPISKAQALRAAQRNLLAEPRYKHASYWASFLLIGNWL